MKLSYLVKVITVGGLLYQTLLTAKLSILDELVSNTNKTTVVSQLVAVKVCILVVISVICNSKK